MYHFVKRLIDLFIAAVTLIVSFPFMLIIVILLKITGEGEIFYFQKRIGYKNQYFDIWKFATMLKNSMNMGSGSITVRDDPRVTSVGKFLRKTKLNEFPQVINVLKGDLSIVGPRPLVDRTFNAYPDELRDLVYNVKPGITGLGSLVFRDEETLISNATEDPHVFYENTIAPYKGLLEMWYQKNASIWTDSKIIFATAWVILRPNSDIVRRWFKGVPERTF